MSAVLVETVQLGTFNIDTKIIEFVHLARNNIINDYRLN